MQWIFARLGPHSLQGQDCAGSLRQQKRIKEGKKRGRRDGKMELGFKKLKNNNKIMKSDLTRWLDQTVQIFSLEIIRLRLIKIWPFFPSPYIYICKPLSIHVPLHGWRIYLLLILFFFFFINLILIGSRFFQRTKI